ncbi:hypothetical protein PR202_gb15870 [Eleusine coracana subsp. coracana]|uniref:Uncharacterized protein n=1 Tax=Eleusine coracana subsp. coracana TaxID=191504 RepID=A0AAV5EZF4_ELECO|nr:hypothetical protein PR202_gb15870 [Eleusine coracana subsp. coracana]
MTTVMSKLSGAALQVGLTALLALFLPAYYVYKLTTYFLGAVFPENVAGKVVLITGASSGIGEHLAYEYAKRGAYLALVARREVSLREVGDRALALGSPGVLVLPADVSKPDQCDKFIDDTIRYFGRLDHLVNNASIWQVCKFEEVEDVNYFRELMASKAAAVNFYDTLRMELGRDIRITEVVPGVVESEITKGKILSKEGEMKVDQDERDAVLGPTPADRVGDFARTVVRDVCRGARYVFEPRWYMGVYFLRACVPEVLAWNSRLLTINRVGASSTDTLGKWLVDLPGVRGIVQPPSLRSPEIKEQ